MIAYPPKQSLFARYSRECLKRNGYKVALAARNCDCWYIFKEEDRLCVLMLNTERKTFALNPFRGYQSRSADIVLLQCLLERMIFEYKPQKAKQMLGLVGDGQ